MTEDPTPFRYRDDPPDLEFLAARLSAEPATKADIVAAVAAMRSDLARFKRDLLLGQVIVLSAAIAALSLLRFFLPPS